MKRLDYGSGRQPKKGFLSSDFCGSPGYDYYIRNYRVLGAKDGSFDVIHCRNVLHHIKETDLPLLFNEFKRLLKLNGYLIISEPREEFHVQNKILDIIWYRYLVSDRKILIPNEYVNYKPFLKDFNLLHSYDQFQNEILIYQIAESQKAFIPLEKAQ